MQIAYFDCFSGISGDMTLAALIDAGADLPVIQETIASMGLGDVRLSVSNTSRRGFRGKLLSIDQPREHAHRHLRDVHLLIRRAKMSSQAKDLAMRFFERIARAEAKVHGTTMDRVQFHEVGAIDSIVDMVGVAVAWDMLAIEKAYASPVPTGAGQIRIAHGTVSVPAPATAELLIGVPIAPSQIPMEMTTPTGAAILTELAVEFGPMPAMQVGRIGYGSGNKDMPDRPNLLRILIGSALKTKPPQTDSVLVIECNLDDVSGEQIGFAIERLWKVGALDVFTMPIQMKKNRPGTLLTVLSRPEDRQAMELILFQQTGTLGLRYRRQARTILPRAIVDVSSPWGIVAGKVSKLPSGEVDFSPEYDDCSHIAIKHGLRLNDVVAEIRECYYSAENARELQYAEESARKESVDLEPDPNRIKNVNAVFREAAFENEYGREDSSNGSAEPPADEPMEPPAELSIDFPIETEHTQDRNEYYRWDSSPWSVSPNEPLQPSQAPRQFPMRGEPDS
jgi:uncharacterized protein (TIGR00299 family) protein